MTTPDSDYTHSINAYYGNHPLGDPILDALRAAGKDPDHLHYTDLTPLDQFHSRGRHSTIELAQLANLKPGQRVLDVGGGLGGPARLLAAEYGCHVTVLDLTEEFCKAGEMLTARTGLSTLVTFHVGNALDMPFPDHAFDVAWTQHSTMNIPHKDRLYAPIHRVLKPGGLLAMHEIAAGTPQPIHYPVPWAATPELSFLLPTADMRDMIASAGFQELAWHDVSAPTLEWFRQRTATAATAPPNPVGINLLLRERTAPGFANLARNLQEGRTQVIMATFRRV
jgi:SAM-dependent methyltransferase